MALLGRAGADCVRRWGRDRGDLDLLIYAGTYRTRFVTEPAIAALLTGALDVNAHPASLNGKRTLAFDVFNGGVAVLNACHVAAEMIRARKAASAMVVAAETENNAAAFPTELLGIEETGSALLLEAADGREGFRAFRFRSFPEHGDAFVSHLTNRNGKTYLRFTQDPDLERYYVRAIVEAVDEFLRGESLDVSHVTKIFPPQISSAFIASLSCAMHVPGDRFVDAVGGGRDLFTSSLPYALRHARDHGLIEEGHVGLFIGVGSGIQVGCALYDF
ncbi:MAG TPA: 3-oxoacyl-[acyl-carrier-protein] synthase III C-terminal domain-containing protein [bacterium]|nr:3-oxoacyl-[acyl-carrier-protein] synthase III C-terminal domain-containing protein [bacterium]